MARNSREKEIYPITIRELEVADIRDITPGMRRVTFTGEQLKSHNAFGVQVPPLISDGFDDDIRIIFPDPVTGERPVPITREDATVQWQEEVKDLFRTYTVRLFDAKRGYLVVDFARHGHGLAEDWSAQAQPGDPIYIAGPKSCAALPTHAPWLLLLGDETALPAIARCIESLPQGYRTVAVVEVESEKDIQDLNHGDDVEIHWQVRERGEDFVRYALRLFGDNPEWAAAEETKPYVWAAGEAGRLKAVRRWVRQFGIAKENVEITGYWRQAAQEGSDEAEQGDTGQRNIVVALHELTDLGPAILVRQAVDMGIFALVDDGCDRVPSLAERVGWGPDEVLRFLRYLESVGLVVAPMTGEDSVELTAMGSELANPDSKVQQWITGPAAAKTEALRHLVRSARESAPTGDYRWDSILCQQSSLAVEEHEQATASAQWTAPAVAKVLSSHLVVDSSIAVGGPAAAVYADELLRKLPELSAVVLGSFSQVEDASVGEQAILGDIAGSRRERAEFRPVHAGLVEQTEAMPALDDVGAVLLVDPWRRWPPLELEGLLRRLKAAGTPCFIVTAILDEKGGEDHDYEEDLSRLVLYGTRLPTARNMARTLSEAGMVLQSQYPVGWAAQLFVVG